MELPTGPESPSEIVEPPPRYAVRSHGRDANIPAVLLVGPPDDPSTRDIADSLADRGVRELVWSGAAWDGSLDDLVHDLACALDEFVHDLAPAALIGIGPGAIPLACLAARRNLPALAVVDAPFGFDPADAQPSGPDWLAAIRRDNTVLRGTLAIDGEPIDLAAITCPVLNLVPGDTEASRALAHLVASDDYAERAFSTVREAGAALAEWLADRQPNGSRPGHGAPQHEVS